MKTQKAPIKADFRVWCTGCSIRIAPNEEQIAKDGKNYHARCYSKQSPALPKMLATRKHHGD